MHSPISQFKSKCVYIYIYIYWYEVFDDLEKLSSRRKLWMTLARIAAVVVKRVPASDVLGRRASKYLRNAMECYDTLL